jgi:hypothetical protein
MDVLTFVGNALWLPDKPAIIMADTGKALTSSQDANIPEALHMFARLRFDEATISQSPESYADGVIR